MTQQNAETNRALINLKNKPDRVFFILRAMPYTQKQSCPLISGYKFSQSSQPKSHN